MAASHYAYNTLTMPGPMGVISIPSDKKDAIICIDKMYRDAVAAAAAEAVVPAKENKQGRKTGKDTGNKSGKHASRECSAPTDDLLESSTSKRSKDVAPVVKKVPAGLVCANGTFTISSTLVDK